MGLKISVICLGGCHAQRRSSPTTIFILAIALQEKLRQQVILEDDFGSLETVAGGTGLLPGYMLQTFTG